MNAGDTFITARPETARDKHLWVIVSDPRQDPEHVLILNLTTSARFYDQTCVLRRGEHRFIQHDSSINYGGGYVLSLQTLREKLAARVIEQREPIGAALLERIRNGAAVTDHLPYDHQMLLQDQGIIF